MLRCKKKGKIIGRKLINVKRCCLLIYQHLLRRKSALDITFFYDSHYYVGSPWTFVTAVGQSIGRDAARSNPAKARSTQRTLLHQSTLIISCNNTNGAHLRCSVTPNCEFSRVIKYTVRTNISLLPPSLCTIWLTL